MEDTEQVSPEIRNEKLSGKRKYNSEIRNFPERENTIY
jgi:hypothetical protein